MKYVFTLCLLISTTFYHNYEAANFIKNNDYTAKKNVVEDSLNSKIKMLEESIKEGSYTRIPNQDFENIINNKIENSLRDSIKWWVFIIAAIASILGYFLKIFLQNTIDTNIKKLQSANEEKIISISSQRFSSIIENLINFEIEIITKKNL